MDKQGLILGAMHAPLQAAHRSRRRAFRSAPTSICVRAPAATAAVWHITPRLRIYACSLEGWKRYRMNSFNCWNRLTA